MEALCELTSEPSIKSSADIFPAFEPLSLDTKAIYDHYINFLPSAVTSPLYFHSLYAWNFTSVNKYKIIDGHLCVVVNDTLAREIYAMPPLGELGGESFASAARAVAEEFERLGLPVVFREVSGFMVPYFSSVNGYKTEISYDRDWSDYLYTRSGLAAGILNAHHRNARRHFERNYSPSVRQLTHDHKETVRGVTRRFFCADRDCSSCFCGCELEVVSRLMESWDELGLKGVLVESEGEPLAFGIGCVQKDEAFFISKKLRRKMRGLDVYLTAAMMDCVFAGCEYVNYSDDLGNEGLREYKTGLAAHTLSHRYAVRLIPE